MSTEWNLSGIPVIVSGALRRALNAGRRFYVAALPPNIPGVFRHKDTAGLEEWRNRQWKMFHTHGRPRAPEIHAVTDDVFNIWRELAARPKRVTRGPQDSGRAFLDNSGLGFRWADKRLILYDEPFAPDGVSDLMAPVETAWCTELQGLFVDLGFQWEWTKHGVKYATRLWGVVK